MGKAADSKIEISSSNPTNIFFHFFWLKPSAFEEDGDFLPPFFKNHYINYRCYRCFTEGLRPPHFWQTNSNYGSLGST